MEADLEWAYIQARQQEFLREAAHVALVQRARATRTPGHGEWLRAVRQFLRTGGRWRQALQQPVLAVLGGQVSAHGDTASRR